jgi:hypothetical protein
MPVLGTRVIVRPPPLFPPRARMSRNYSDNRLSGDAMHDLHFTMTNGTLQQINLPYFFDAFPAGWRWDTPQIAAIRSRRNVWFFITFSVSSKIVKNSESAGWHLTHFSSQPVIMH